MLTYCFILLSIAMVLGGCLLAGKLGRLAVVHGAAGAAGLVLLVVAWRHARLSGPFALDALVLLAAGFCGGLLIATLKWRQRPAPGLLLILHATAGGLAYLLLAGFLFGH